MAVVAFVRNMEGIRLRTNPKGKRMKIIDSYTVYVCKEYEPNTMFLEKLVKKYLEYKYDDDEKYFISSIEFTGDVILDE